MGQNTPTGCGNDFPALLTNHDFEDCRQCLSDNYFVDVICGMASTMKMGGHGKADKKQLEVADQRDLFQIIPA